MDSRTRSAIIAACISTFALGFIGWLVVTRGPVTDYQMLGRDAATDLDSGGQGAVVANYATAAADGTVTHIKTGTIVGATSPTDADFSDRPFVPHVEHAERVPTHLSGRDAKRSAPAQGVKARGAGFVSVALPQQMAVSDNRLPRHAPAESGRISGARNDQLADPLDDSRSLVAMANALGKEQLDSIQVATPTEGDTGWMDYLSQRRLTDVFPR